MKELKGTKTEKNLQEAFAGESQARNKYTYFASKAKKDGFVQIANIFEETAANERSTLSCGSSIWRAVLSRIQRRTWKLLPMVSMMSGPICIHAWQRRLAKKVSRRLQLSLRWLLKSRSIMRSVIASS